MKRLLFPGALLALTILLVSSCTSPTDVPAGRKETTILAPVSVTPTKDVGKIAPNTAHTFTIEISNPSTTDSATITDIRLKDGTKGFTLSLPALPLKLGRKGEVDKITLVGTFRESVAGDYNDEIIIVNNDTSTTCKVHAIIITNAIIVSDIDFGTVTFGNKAVYTARITNDGDAPATIMSASMQGASAIDFTDLGTLILPMELPAGDIIEFQVVYSPQQAGQSNAQLVFEIDYNGGGTVDNVAILTGIAQ